MAFSATARSAFAGRTTPDVIPRGVLPTPPKAEVTVLVASATTDTLLLPLLET